MNNLFDTDFSLAEIRFSSLEIIFIVALSLLLLVQLYYYLYYFRGIIRNKKREEKGRNDYSTSEEGVSVIICAKNEAENLRKFLPTVLEQDYPNYEVIVVDDASQDGTEDYLKLTQKSYPHLRSTFVPMGATNLSTKKLAISLGIKAAKNDILLFTDADCVPEGKDWIRKMTRNFTDNIDFVLGYGGYLNRGGFLNKMIRYDTLFIAIQYLGMAFHQKAYMGVGRNMAYRKSTFNKLKGFAGTLNIQSGDDDLLVNKGANSSNTRIETDKESVTWSEPKVRFRVWLNQKRRHLSVSDRYNQESKIRLAIEPITRGLFYTTMILTFVYGSVYAIAVTSFIFLLRYLIQLITINSVAKIFGEKKFFLSIPFFDMLLPLISLKLMFFEKKNKNIRWK